jgi:hypothetical protein
MTPKIYPPKQEDYINGGNLTSSTTFKFPTIIFKKNMHTNFTPEIKGTYTKKDWWIDLAVNVAITGVLLVMFLGILLALFDMATGYELHTYLAEIVN